MSKTIHLKLPVVTTATELLAAVRESGFAARRWTPGEADTVADFINELQSYIVNKRHHAAWTRNHIASCFEHTPSLVLEALNDVIHEHGVAECWDPRVSNRLRKIADAIDRDLEDANPSPSPASPAKVEP